MKRVKVIMSVICAGFLMTSCLDDDGNGQNEIPQNVGWLAFINASPDSENLKFYSNGSLLNSQTIDYGQLFGYIYNEVGDKSITVRTSSEDLDTLNLNLQKDKFYSIYAINSVDHLELIALNDNHSFPSTGKTAIRFIQLSENAPELKVAIEGSTTNYGTYQYKDFSTFMESPIIISKNLYLIDASSNDTLISKNVNFYEGRSYSIFSKGIYGSTDENKKLDIQVIPFQN